MRHFAILPALALLLACNQQESDTATGTAPDAVPGVGETATNAPPPGNAAEPADGGNGAGDDGAEPGMRWNFAQASTGPKLAYGEPATDNVKLLLRCGGSDSVRISFIRPAGSAGGEFVLRSGGAERRIDASAHESEIGGATIQATAPIGAQPLQNFRSGNPLVVRWQEETISVPAAGNEARRFFDACRASG